MGCHGGPGDGTGRARAASGKAPAARAYGRSQKAFVRRLPARQRDAASGPGQMQAVSRERPADHLSRLRPWRWTGLSRVGGAARSMTMRGGGRRISASWASANIFDFQTANSAVIASEAKQSIYPLATQWIASSLTLLAMTGSTYPRSRGMFRPRFCKFVGPLETEGAGKAGCRLHPRSRVPKVCIMAHTSI